MPESFFSLTFSFRENTLFPITPGAMCEIRKCCHAEAEIRMITIDIDGKKQERL